MPYPLESRRAVPHQPLGGGPGELPEGGRRQEVRRADLAAAGPCIPRLGRKEGDGATESQKGDIPEGAYGARLPPLYFLQGTVPRPPQSSSSLAEAALGLRRRLGQSGPSGEPACRPQGRGDCPQVATRRRKPQVMGHQGENPPGLRPQGPLCLAV